MIIIPSFLVLALSVVVQSAVFSSTDELESLVENQKILIDKLIVIKEKFEIPAEHFVAR
jgi:hypothetical protein